MKTSTMVWVVVIVLVVLGLGWYLWAQTAPTPEILTPAPSSTDVTSPQPATTTGQTTTFKTVTVTYGANGFSPSTVTIAKGDTVMFAAAAGADEMWIASDPHPTHQGYDGTTRAQHCVANYTGAAPFDQCSAGTTFSFTFDKVGTFGYHNHGNPNDHGTVVVQ